jgi:hypothetical protein
VQAILHDSFAVNKNLTILNCKQYFEYTQTYAIIIIIIIIIIIKEFNIEDRVAYTMKSTRGIAATLYTLETWFVSGV